MAPEILNCPTPAVLRIISISLIQNFGEMRAEAEISQSFNVYLLAAMWDCFDGNSSNEF